MGTVIVGGIVVLVAGLAVRSIVKDKKSGKGCNGNCRKLWRTLPLRRIIRFLHMKLSRQLYQGRI